MVTNRVFPRRESFLETTVPNPFEYNIKLSLWEKVQIAMATVTIVPIRAFFMFFFLCLAWPVAFCATYGMENKLGKVPLTGWRRFLRESVFYACLRLSYYFSSFHDLRIKGVPKADSIHAPILVCGPHTTWWDAMTIVLAAHCPGGVSRIESSKAPILGRLIDFLQPVYVMREDPNSKKNTIEEIKRRAQSRGQWPQIVIFPEGTTTNGRALITFKPGAFIPAVPVQPALVRYPNRLDTTTWTWDGPGALKLLWLTLCQVHTKVEVEFLPVYTPDEQEKQDPKLFAANVRQVMANALGIPVTDHSFDDCRLMLKSKKKNLPHRTGLVEFAKLHDKLGLSWDEVSQSLDKFADIARGQDGKIGVEEFAAYLGLPISPALSEVFNLYDRNGSGGIDFREYVIGLSLVSQPANSDETLKRAFQIFDQRNEGFITFSQGKHILENAFQMSEEGVSDLFRKIDKENTGKIYYEEFSAFVREKPEYASLFLAYEELNSQREADEDVEEVIGEAENQLASNSTTTNPAGPESDGPSDLVTSQPRARKLKC